MRIAVLRKKIRGKDDRVEQRSESASAFSRKPIGGMRRAAVPCAKLSGLSAVKRKHRKVLVRNPAGLRHQFQGVGHLLAKARAHRLAGIDQNGDLEFRPVRSGKALEIADD